MSTLLFIGVIGLLISGYVFFGNYLTKLFKIDPSRKTPAFTKYDGVDYVPAKNWIILFGHHFASIAGAGPIIGPVLAYQLWGWLGVLLWIVFGSVFLGAVHDFSSLIVSLREEGASIGQIAQEYISKRASIIFLIFLWFALIIVIAVFASICAKSFIGQPQIVISSLGLIPVSIFIGFLIYKLRINIALATIIGIACLFFLIVTGSFFPLEVSIENSYIFWVSLLLVYAFFASIIPVHILLQPRDYLSSFLLLFGIAAAFVGIILKPLSLKSAKLISFHSSAGPLFPIMFITVACGAISGFHSLVSSGTTSKQLVQENDAKKIGYGAMILEAVLATVVLFSLAFGIKNIPQERLEAGELFSLGFSSVSFFLGRYAKFIAFMMLNAFILTTLDTATRITRLLTQELLKIKNKWFATTIVIIVAGYLALMEKWQVLWPIFGASNQLVAALALVVVSAWLFHKGKKYKVTFIPAVIMVIITISALLLKIRDFLNNQKYLLSFIGVILIILGIFTIFEFRKVVKRKFK